MLFKLEFSNYVNKNKKIKNDIINILNKDFEKEKKLNLMKIIDKFISKKIEIVNKIDDLDNYEIVNERQICEKYNDNNYNKFHCKKVNNKYKYILLKNNILNDKDNKILYTQKLMGELIRFDMKKNYILNNKLPIFVDIDEISFNNDVFINLILIKI